jgi:D-Tyr-tRNAtyr deacylase
MNRKGSILMISLWIVAIMTVFAVGLGHRASINLKTSRFQRDRLKANLLAKSATSIAMLEIDKDNREYDSLDEKWTDNKGLFEKIGPNQNEKEYATVSYLTPRNETRFGLLDEEGKINLNTKNIKLLTQLFQSQFALADAENLANLTVQWTTSEEPKTGEELFKKAPLSAPEELQLILEYYLKDKEKAQASFSRLKDLITVYGQGKINLNTVGEEVLTILVSSLATNDELACVQPIVRAVLTLRGNVGHFMNKYGIIVADLTEPCPGLLNKLLTEVVFLSSNFRIQAIGKVGNVKKSITAVYNREEKSILYWHEN